MTIPDSNSQEGGKVELLPCPFCGGNPSTLERPDNIDGTEFFYAVSCYCGGYSACAHKMARRKTSEEAKADAATAWNCRPTPSQEGRSSLSVEPATTPAAQWRVNGEPDPHGNRYDCERAALAMGTYSDDELANGAFMNYDQPLDIHKIVNRVPGYYSPIAWMTAVKDRIRWLSRKVEGLRGVAGEYDAWIRFHSAGNGDYDDFLRKHVLPEEQA